MTPAEARARLNATTGDPVACPVCGTVAGAAVHPCRFQLACKCWRGRPCKAQKP